MPSIDRLEITDRHYYMAYMDKATQYGRVFEHFDEDGDGRISAKELRHCVEAIGGELREEEAEAAVEYLDADGDGLVGLEDFVRFVDGGEEEEKVKDLREAFKMYEMEGSGCITPKSLSSMLSRLGESRSADECQVMISRFDLNGDGVLTFDEFKWLPAKVRSLSSIESRYSLYV